ncbi:MAG: hypothetical protein GY913_13680 [Proteobacteria bacterium]|nr:hypothetical protein [Pseudomonadota bacterium]MCP4917958.1 hypothetical protein [Pseudomonadota bacterium]
MKRLAIGGVVGLGLVGGALATQLESGPTYEPWIDPLPEYAVSAGYWDFRDTEGGLAIPWWPDTWFGWDPPRGDGPLLIDRRHATKQLETDSLTIDAYSYDSQHGLHRAFEPARVSGVRLQPVWEPWTPGALGGASAVFINLVSGDNPGFRHSEVLALESFVRHGGGLVLITDHTNCYFHAEMLQELSDAFGFDIWPNTASDRGDGNRLSPRSVAWIRVRPSEVEHPVTRDVDIAGWMNGGVVKPHDDSELDGLMQNSAEGWADLLDPYKKAESSGFTGNLKWDDDELAGPHSVVLAGRHGQGRVVVLADQNAWGSTLVGYEDNSRLFANALGWAMGTDLDLEVRGPRSVTVVGGNRSLCTSAADYGFRTMSVQVQRLSEERSYPEFCTADAATDSQGVLLLPEAERADLVELLDRDHVLAVIDPEHAGSLAVLEQLGLSWEAGEPVSGLTWHEPHPELRNPVFDEVPAEEPVTLSPIRLDRAGTVIASAQGVPVVVEIDGVRLLLAPELLANAAMGGERERPWQESPERATAHRAAFHLLDGLFPAP